MCKRGIHAIYFGTRTIFSRAMPKIFCSVKDPYNSADIMRKVGEPLYLQRRREQKRARLERETPEQSELRCQAIKTKTKSRRVSRKPASSSSRRREQRRARLERETPVHMYRLLCFRGCKSFSKSLIMQRER